MLKTLPYERLTEITYQCAPVIFFTEVKFAYIYLLKKKKEKSFLNIYLEPGFEYSGKENQRCPIQASRSNLDCGST